MNVKQNDFTAIPGNTIAYWLSPPMRNSFSNHRKLADFAMPFLCISEKGPADSIPASTKSETRKDIERGDKYPEDTQQHNSN